MEVKGDWGKSRESILKVLILRANICVGSRLQKYWFLSDKVIITKVSPTMIGRSSFYW